MFFIWSEIFIKSIFYSFILFVVYSNSQMAVHSRGQELIYSNIFLKIDQREGAVWTIHEKQNNIANH